MYDVRVPRKVYCTINGKMCFLHNMENLCNLSAVSMEKKT